MKEKKISNPPTTARIPISCDSTGLKLDNNEKAANKIPATIFDKINAIGAIKISVQVKSPVSPISSRFVAKKALTFVTLLLFFDASLSCLCLIFLHILSAIFGNNFRKKNTENNELIALIKNIRVAIDGVAPISFATTTTMKEAII